MELVIHNFHLDRVDEDGSTLSSRPLTDEETQKVVKVIEGALSEGWGLKAIEDLQEEFSGSSERDHTVEWEHTLRP